MSQKKPNVLIIMADQQRYDTICEGGYTHMITPNLDRLCQEGCLFTDAHTHNPVCMPARHDLLTGLTGKGHGYYANAGGKPIKDYGLPTIPRIFSANGYRTASIGKMHFFPVRAHHGYNEMYTMEEIPKLREDDDFAMHLKANGDGDVQNIHGVRPLAYHTPQKSLVKEENYETRWVENTTMDWLDRNGDNPFFLFVGYIKPHPPWDIPEQYAGMYKDAKFPPVIERSRYYPERSETNGWYGDLDSKEQLRKNREAYYTACSMVDESVGKIIEHLRETGEIDNTLIIYTSDHGEMLGDKGFYSKDIPYESAVRVPMIVRYPEKFKPGTKDSTFVDLLDIFPTCLDVAGLEYPQCDHQLFGSSLFDLEHGKDREVILASNGFLAPNRWVMARSKEYKYIYRFNQGYEELYDLVNDSGETKNCIDTLKGSEVYQTLRAKALAYEIEQGPEGSIVDGDFAVLEGTLNKGHEHGKYHIWSNMQFQKFLKQDKKEFGTTFMKEVKEALSKEDISGCDIKEIFNNPDWKACFKQYFEEIGEFENWEKELFKDE